MLSNIILGWKGVAITGAAALVFGFGGGWKAHSIVTDAATAKAMIKAQDEHEKKLDALQGDLDEAANERLRLSGELSEARANVRIVTREVIKEIPKYVEDSTPECDRSVPAGLAVLYNSSLGIDPEDSSGQSRTARERAGALRGNGSDGNGQEGGTNRGLAGYPTE